jgi:uncharacterized damage-inducible protein DinB
VPSKPKQDLLAKHFLLEAKATFDRHLSSINKSLAQLSDEEIWWRPNSASNSVGNIVLHLSGNVRQWIISGLGGVLDIRERDEEFSARGIIPRAKVVAHLRATVRAARCVLDTLSADALTRKYTIQGYHVTGLQAISNVYEHFSHHAGQIIYVTKLKRGKDLRFTHLPPIKKAKRLPPPRSRS